MKLMVLVEDYCSQENQSLTYVHSRNIAYAKFNPDVEIVVLSFRAVNNYSIDGIEVITFTEYTASLSKHKFDILISHAPNIRNHIRFILKYSANFKKFVFFFHGHEVLKINKYYPEPYKYVGNGSTVAKISRDIYDSAKLRIIKYMLNRYWKKTWMVFVSNWMKEQFVKNVKLVKSRVDERSSVIYNNVNAIYEELTYDKRKSKKCDFITIRSNLDGSKYAIDVVVKLAECNPGQTFHVIGKGRFFDHFDKPENLTYELKHIRPGEIPEVLDQARCALMPTRLDAQGVMACEMSAYGMPLVTSDIEVCKEIFGGFDNVELIDNKGDANLEIVLNRLEARIASGIERRSRYDLANTVANEMRLFAELVGETIGREGFLV